MTEQKFEKHVPEHPLPKEIQDMKKDDTVCQFCGVSYLIHSEMKALEERVKDAERQMEYYKGSVEREEKLKLKVKSMEEESDKLSRALQASEERSKIFITELNLKVAELESQKQERNKLEAKLKASEYVNKVLNSNVKELTGLFPRILMQLKTQKTDLAAMTTDVKTKDKEMLDDVQNMNKKVAGACRKNAEIFEALKNKLSKAETDKGTLEKSSKEFQSKFSSAQSELKGLRVMGGKVKDLQSKCSVLEEETKRQQEEIERTAAQNQTYASEISQYKEIMMSKTTEAEEFKQKLLKQEESSKQEKRKLQEVILHKENELFKVSAECTDLKRQIEEWNKTESETMEKASSSQDQVKTLKDLLSKAKDELIALKEEREKMITAHHNRIEQLRESFKKKMEEADAWPDKFDKAVREQQERFKKEKDDLWKELNDSYQKEIQEEHHRHADELRQCKSQAKLAQDKSRDDLNSLNRKHREEMRTLRDSSQEEKDQLTQLKKSSSAIINSLEAKIADLEWRLHQRANTSVEEVIMLKTRIQDLEQTVDEADQHIKELETQVESSKEQILFLQETVRCECEERLELTDALSEARTQLLAVQRSSGPSLSRTSASHSSSNLGRASEAVLGSESSNEISSSTCTVGLGGVGPKPSRGSPSHGSRDSGRQSRSGSVDDSRQRIAAAMGRTGSKSRLGAGNYTS